MKIKKAFDICKKNKVISIFGNEKGEQWLSDGYVVYPIFGLPELNEDYICKLYDINDAQRDKIRFTISQTKPLIDVEDCSADETPAEMWDISIIYDGKVMLPISTAEGLMFIDRVYLNPFVDMPNKTMTLALLHRQVILSCFSKSYRFQCIMISIVSQNLHQQFHKHI